MFKHQPQGSCIDWLLSYMSKSAHCMNPLSKFSDLGLMEISLPCSYLGTPINSRSTFDLGIIALKRPICLSVGLAWVCPLAVSI